MSNEQKPLSERDDLGSDETRCTECGGPIMYGSRHHHCGTVAMKYQKQLAALQAKLDRAVELLKGDSSVASWWDERDAFLAEINAQRLLLEKEKNGG